MITHFSQHFHATGRVGLAKQPHSLVRNTDLSSRVILAKTKDHASTLGTSSVSRFSQASTWCVSHCYSDLFAKLQVLITERRKLSQQSFKFRRSTLRPACPTVMTFMLSDWFALFFVVVSFSLFAGRSCFFLRSPNRRFMKEYLWLFI